MILFRYRPASIAFSDRPGNPLIAFANVFPDHSQWLVDNEVVYRVEAFYWPQITSKLVAEFDIIIDREPDAVMFALFSGMDGNEW